MLYLRQKKAVCAATCGLHDMTEIYADFVADHTFDHLRLRTTRILCREEHTKAVNPDAKAPKSPPNHTKNQVFSVWDVDAAGSNPVTPTKFGFGKQFSKPFSLLSATQILRADGLFSVSPLSVTVSFSSTVSK